MSLCTLTARINLAAQADLPEGRYDHIRQQFVLPDGNLLHNATTMVHYTQSLTTGGTRDNDRDDMNP